MKISKSKSIAELKNSIFETFDEVVAGETQVITNENGKMIVLISIDQLEELYEQVDLNENLSIGYSQMLRGESITTAELLEKLKNNRKKPT